MKMLRSTRLALVGACCTLVGAAVVPVIGLAGSIAGSTGDGPMVLQSGETVLSYQGRMNVSSILSPADPGLWLRVGDTVQMSGHIGVNPTTSGIATGVYIPLPVDSALGATNNNCAGTATVNYGSGGYSAAQIQIATAAGHTHQCYLEYNTASTTINWIHYSLTYRVKD
jgi:hypothetical protein